jgi:hypothetical protein
MSTYPGKETNNVKKSVLLGILAVGIGLLIAWIDTRPTWDDTGITVAAIFGSTLLLGAALPGRAWLWALAVGIWIPLFNIVLNSNYGAVASLVVAFAGSYAGAFLRRALSATSAEKNVS